MHHELRFFVFRGSRAELRVRGRHVRNVPSEPHDRRHRGGILDHLPTTDELVDD